MGNDGIREDVEQPNILSLNEIIQREIVCDATLQSNAVENSPRKMTFTVKSTINPYEAYDEESQT